MPRPAISPLHDRLRRVALGLEKRNLPHHQLRALADLDRMERPRSPRKRRQITPERIAWYAGLLAELTVAGSGDPVRGAFADPKVAAAARYYLTTLSDPISREVIRQVWLRNPTGPLTDLVRQRLPTEPGDLAVTLFLLGDFDRYVLADPSGALVEAARAEGDPALRVQLATAARRWNRLDWAYRVAAVPERLLPEEWDAVIRLLTAGERQEYLWQLIERAPLVWSARCLAELDGGGAADRDALVVLAKRYLKRARKSQPFKLLGLLEGQEQDRFGHDWEPSHSLVTPDGSTLLGLGSYVSRWTLPAEPPPSGPEQLRAAGSLAGGRVAAVSPDGSLFAVIAEPGAYIGDADRVRLFRLPDGKPAGELRARGHEPGSLIFTPDGTGLLSLAPAKAAFWRLPTATPGAPSPGAPSPGTPSPGTPTPGTPSPGTPTPGTPTPGASTPGTSTPRRVRRVERMFAARRPTSRFKRQAKVAFSPDGRRVAVGVGDFVRLRHWPGGATLATLRARADDLQIIGDTVTISTPMRARVVQLSTGTTTAELRLGDRTPPLVTPNGDYLVSVSPGTPAIWRLPGCTPVAHPSSPSRNRAPAHAAITGDSRILVSSDHKRAELFEIPSGRRIGRVELTRVKVLPTTDGALLLGYNRMRQLEVRRYRPSTLAELAERPIRDLTPAETEHFHNRYDDPADAALAQLGVAVLRYLRRDRPRDL